MADCEYCHKPGHVWFQCPKKPDGWKPERLAKKQRGPRQSAGNGAGAVPLGGGSSASRLRSPKADTIPTAGSSSGRTAEFDSANTGSNPVPASNPKRKDTRKGDRHSPGYMAKYMREYRAKLKAQKEMGK